MVAISQVIAQSTPITTSGTNETETQARALDAQEIAALAEAEPVQVERLDPGKAPCEPSSKGGWMFFDERPAGYLSTRDAAKYTRQSPRLVLNRAGSLSSIEFVEPCPGDDCLGTTVWRYGAEAQYGKEVACPLHTGRWHERVLAARKPARIAYTHLEPKMREYAMRGLDDSLATWAGPEILGQAMRDWVDDPGRPHMLLLRGPYGTGKSCLAAALMGELLKGDVQGLWISSAELLQRLMPDADEQYTDSLQAGILTRVKTVDVLVLDDLGAEHGTTPFARSQLQDILNSRSESGKPTIATSNYLIMSLDRDKILNARAGGSTDTETLEDRIGARAAERFQDETRALIIRFPASAKMRRAAEITESNAAARIRPREISAGD